MSRIRDVRTGLIVLVLSVGIVLAYGIVGSLPTATTAAPHAAGAQVTGADGESD